MSKYNLLQKTTIALLACCLLCSCGIKGELDLEEDIDEQVDVRF